MILYSLLAVATVLFIAFFIYQQRKLKKHASHSQKTLRFFKQMEDFSPSYALIGVADDSGHIRSMAIDGERELICLYDQNDETPCKMLSYGDIFSTEVFENGISISYFSGDSKILKFNFEKELEEGEKKVKSLSVECAFESGDVPPFRVYTLFSSAFADPGEYHLKKEETNKWHHLMIKIIEQNHRPLKRID